MSQKERTTIYIESATKQEFKNICNREGESMSEKVEGFMRLYNDKHRIGNPQTRLDMCGVKTKHECHCGEAATHEVWNFQGEKFFLCEAHYIQNRDARLLKRWKTLK